MKISFILIILLVANFGNAQSQLFKNKKWEDAILKAIRKNNFDKFESILLTRNVIIDLSVGEELKGKLLALHSTHFYSARELFYSQLNTQQKTGMLKGKLKILEMRIYNDSDGIKKIIYLQLVSNKTNFMLRFPNCYLNKNFVYTTGELEITNLSHLIQDEGI